MTHRAGCISKLYDDSSNAKQPLSVRAARSFYPKWRRHIRQVSFCTSEPQGYSSAFGRLAKGGSAFPYIWLIM
jgi:hypothetical protein